VPEARHISHSYSSLLGHAVFSTKERRNIIPTELLPRLHAYMGGVARRKGFTALGVGGIENHIHALLVIPHSMKPGDAVQAIKTNSSRWMKEFVGDFEWQRGYAIFSVSESNKEDVLSYVANQREHHRKMTFEEEFLELLKRHNVPYDPKYVFG
jgi:putative transposase